MEAIKAEDKRKIKPRFIGTKKEKARGQGRVVMINVTESSLDTLRSKKVLNNIQYFTALKFRRLWEKSRIGSYTSNFHKVGEMNGWNDMAVDRVEAIYKLSRSHTWLGDYSFQILYRICVEDFTVKELAAKHQMHRSYAGQRLREAIDEFRKFLDQSY
jgi:YesN/AraC family two-component response regulator